MEPALVRSSFTVTTCFPGLVLLTAAPSTESVAGSISDWAPPLAPGRPTAFLSCSASLRTALKSLA